MDGKIFSTATFHFDLEHFVETILLTNDYLVNHAHELDSGNYTISDDFNLDKPTKITGNITLTVDGDINAKTSAFIVEKGAILTVVGEGSIAGTSATFLTTEYLFGAQVHAR